MSQQSFTFTAPPRSRRTDPASSRRAEDRMRKTGSLRGQALVVLEAMKRHPGLSSKQLAEVEVLDRHVVARRCPDLWRAGVALKVETLSSDVKWYAIL